MLFSENPHFKILTLCTLCLKIVEDFDKQSLINQGINNFIGNFKNFYYQLQKMVHFDSTTYEISIPDIQVTQPFE